jgi:plasmid stability protein
VRTTLTLDDDLVARLRVEVRRTGKSMKEVVNEYLRRGLNARRELATQEPFKVRALNMRLREGLSYDNIGELLEQVEGPAQR